MAQEKLTAVESAITEALAAIRALGVGDIDGQARADADAAVCVALQHIHAGFKVRADERARVDAARIYQLYLDGKLVEKK